MRHPTEGVLRRLLDEPVAVADSDRAHAAGCPQCLGVLAAMRQDAALVESALTADQAPQVDVAAAWQRLSSATAMKATGSSTSRVTAPHWAGRFRALLRRPVVGALTVAVVLGGAGAAAANDWLQIFKTQQIAPVSITAADLNAMPDLSAYGDLVLTGEPDLHEVPDAAAAAAQSGLDVPEVTTLARGVSGKPAYQVGSALTATFTFSVDRAARAAADAGKALPPAPAGLDGSQVRLVAGPGVAQIWASSVGAPALVIGRAVAPTAFSSSGVSFETMRDYLLSMPGLPQNVAAPLRTFNADGSTLPLPVPAEEVTTSSAQVNGVPATVLATRDRTLAAVVWVDDGVVTAVAGSLDAEELLTIAEGLR